MQLLDGKKTSEEIQLEIAAEVQKRKSAGLKIPHLAAVLVGNDGASQTYVGSKVRTCEKLGLKSSLFEYPAEITESELLSVIKKLNEDIEIDGYIVQLPLPKHINEEKIITAINPLKDVDGFHPENVGKMCIGLPSFLPATPFGIMKLLEKYKIETDGKHCVILGRSNIVGTPMSVLLSRKSYPGNCTVTMAHSRTKNIPELCKTADIIIAALGIPGFVKADMIKKGAVVIDVGITRVEDSTKKNGYRIEGDVDFHSVASLCSYITPVPGGVGPMTICGLLLNTLKAAENK
jgi:methylenetetrahydrofolate dehydrogenase (NADP+) / methenyltetrahydrofolate cyclohydrolase